MSGLRVISYFSLPTDLAGEMSQWSEFVTGSEYCVELRDPETGETVTTRLIEEDEGLPYLEIRSTAVGRLFDRVAGRAIFALAHHSDNLMVDRHLAS